MIAVCDSPVKLLLVNSPVKSLFVDSGWDQERNMTVVSEYVYIYVYTYICLYIYIYMYIHMRRGTCMVCMDTYMYVCVYIYVHICILWSGRDWLHTAVAWRLCPLVGEAR